MLSKRAKKLLKTYLNLNLYEDSISMWVADMDFKVAPEIVEAVKQRAEMATFGYASTSPQYYQALQDWYKKRHNMEFTPDQVVMSNGTLTAITATVRTFTKEGDGVIIQSPVYFPFSSITQENR